MTDNGFDYREAADKRRRTRRELEKGMSGAVTDKIQLNDIMLGALVFIAAIVSFTDFSFSFGDLRNLTALTLFLYVITMLVYRNRYDKGKARGKKDEEYIASLEEYRGSRNKIYELGLASRVPEFCAQYKREELREYRESLLCDIEMSYGVYKEKYITMPYRELMRQPLSREAKRIIAKCNAAKSVRLYQGMLLNESGEYGREQIIGKSGRERERRDKKKQALTRALYVVLGATAAFDVIFNFSLLTLAQWIVRMLPVVIAVMSGDDGGYCNITVTETGFKRGQTRVINLFLEWNDTCRSE